MMSDKLKNLKWPIHRTTGLAAVGIIIAVIQQYVNDLMNSPDHHHITYVDKWGLAVVFLISVRLAYGQPPQKMGDPDPDDNLQTNQSK